jgi:hypothetical protein
MNEPKRWKVTVSRSNPYGLGATTILAMDEDEARKLAEAACPGWDVGWVRPATRYDPD